MSKSPNFPILEFDLNRTALIEPDKIIAQQKTLGSPDFAQTNLPTAVVLCFFQDVIEQVVREHGGREVARLRSEIGINPIYEINFQGQSVALVHPGVGAPLAAAFLEELIALGCRYFMAAGGAGALVPNLTLGQIIVPTAAIRDEGTSYHYLPPGREIAVDPRALTAINKVLSAHNLSFVAGKTWTTDAIYRETRRQVEARVAEGCLTVEMETAACLAVAAFRGVLFGQLLYAGDDLSGADWDDRNWLTYASGRERLFWLAAEVVLSLRAANPDQ